MSEMQLAKPTKMMKKYTPEQIAAMDKAADKQVFGMMLAGVGLGVVPIVFDVLGLCVGMATGVIYIAECFDVKLTKDDAADLITQFFKTAGLAYSMLFFGSKFTGSILKSNAVSYVPAMIADGVLCGATFFAVGNTAKQFFRRKAEGKKVTKDEMRSWMQEGKKQGEALAKEHAKKAAEKRAAEQKAKKNGKQAAEEPAALQEGTMTPEEIIAATVAKYSSEEQDEQEENRDDPEA